MLDYLIVGAGPFGAAFARTAADYGKKCLVIDKRPHVAGNAYTERKHDIDVHMYGVHIFHTDMEHIWGFVNRFGDWHQTKYNPRVFSQGGVYSFPVNLFTMYQLWGVKTPAEAAAKLEEVRYTFDQPPRNAEEWILANVGEEIYHKFFYGYTKKQWFKEPSRLPASIITRLPFRLTYNDSYFGTKYQAVPTYGYTTFYEAMLDHPNIEVRLEQDFFTHYENWKTMADRLIFTGPIDRFFGHSQGKLEYRSLRFDHQVFKGDYQGHIAINHNDLDVPYIRSIEHKHFFPGAKHSVTLGDKPTVVTFDHPIPPAEMDDDPQYPIRDAANSYMYNEYRKLAALEPRILFGGRLGEYQYYDLDQAMASAIAKAKKEVVDG